MQTSSAPQRLILTANHVCPTNPELKAGVNAGRDQRGLPTLHTEKHITTQVLLSYTPFHSRERALSVRLCSRVCLWDGKGSPSTPERQSSVEATGLRQKAPRIQ